jgi:cytochrome c-type biogenesis protein
MRIEEVSIGVAFAAGLFSFLSPCVLPLVPGYISFVSGVSLEELKGNADGKNIIKRSVVMSAFFVLGFSAVFVALGATATSLGQLLTRHIHILTKIAGVVVVIFGIHLSGIFRIPLLEYHKKLDISPGKHGVLGALLVGFAFGFGWTPCIGPLLGGILAIAATERTLARGVTLLCAYSLGLGIPFMATAFAISGFTRFFEKYRRFIRWGETVAGVFLIAVGIMIFFDKLGSIAYGLQDIFGV